MKAGFVTVGETLSDARRRRGLSVEDVAADTRIRATVIRAIEADEFRLCGGNVYARGHIRSIAKVLGIDGEPLVADFDTEHQVERVVAAVAAPPPDREIVTRSERHGPNWVGAMAVALAVICVLAVIGMVAGRGNGGGKGQQAKSHGGVSTQSTPPAPPAQPPPTIAAAPPAERATMVVRTVHGQTWLSITSKTGTVLFEGLVPAGERKKFTNRHGLTFVIGNAPAVDVVVNGHDIGSPPSSGSVSRGNVTPGADNVQQA
jgi:cytoskeletal protein RodZ